MATNSGDGLAERMFQQWRRRRQAEAAPSAPPGADAARGVRLMIVEQVVPTDAAHGAHLLARPARFVGTPPTPQPCGPAPIRCHPAPGQPVTAFTVGELIKVFTAPGANVAERMAN